MGRVDVLPPPPVVPQRSPPVTVAGEIETRIEGLGGRPSLEARVHDAPWARRAVVLCHPHPLYGGSMHSPVPLALAKALSEHAAGTVSWLRFNFRGVGTSEGTYDAGLGEVDDACAAIEHLRGLAPGAAVTVCGHSFGSWVGLRAAARERVERVLLLAPSVRFFEFRDEDIAFAGQKAIFVGSEDELTDIDEARALALRLGAELRVFEGFDHQFLRSRRALAEMALPFLAPEHQAHQAPTNPQAQ